MEEMKPIQAKKYIVDHYNEYPFGMEKKEDMIALLNILQANRENLDTMHHVVFADEREFMGILGRWDDDKDLYHSVLAFNTFYTEKEFIEWMLERIDDLKNDGFDDIAAEIHSWTYDDEASDTWVIKTEDGYVVRVSY